MSQSENLIGSEFYLPYDRNLLDRAKEMRRCPTLAERKLWNLYLKSFRVRVLRQRPIDYFIVDFFCAALRLVIEVDGGVHFTEQGQAHDAARSEILKGYGLRVLRFTNEEVMEKFEWVCEVIDGIDSPVPLNNPPQKPSLHTTKNLP